MAIRGVSAKSVEAERTIIPRIELLPMTTRTPIEILCVSGRRQLSKNSVGAEEQNS
ncbi:13825_t:CDS:2, partial [Acaulospora colombiana]